MNSIMNEKKISERIATQIVSIGRLPEWCLKSSSRVMDGKGLRKQSQQAQGWKGEAGPNGRSEAKPWTA